MRPTPGLALPGMGPPNAYLARKWLKQFFLDIITPRWAA
jgi:hypothetical protein